MAQVTTDRGIGLADPPLPFSGGRFPNSEAELAFVERRILRLYLIAPGLAFAALIIGFERGWPQLAAAGVIGLGLTGIAIGAYAASERRLMFITRSFMKRSFRFVLYEGIAAIPFGCAALVAGAVMVVSAGLFLAGIGLDEMRATVLARPGYALTPIGVLLLSYGLGFVIGFVDRSGSTGQRAFNVVLDLPARLGGLLLLALGGAALAIGLVEGMSPATFDLAFQSMFGNPWPFR